MSQQDTDEGATDTTRIDTLAANVSAVADRAVGMGLFIGLLLASGVLLLLREADLVAFDIPNGLLAIVVLTALLVGATMDTSVVPDK